MMAIGQALLTLVALCDFCLAFASLGNAILRSLRFEMEKDAEHLLVAVGAGLVSTEILLFLIQFTQHIRQGSLAIIGLLCVPLISESASVLRRFWVVSQLLGSRSRDRNRDAPIFGIAVPADTLTVSGAPFMLRELTSLITTPLRLSVSTERVFSLFSRQLAHIRIR